MLTFQPDLQDYGDGWPGTPLYDRSHTNAIKCFNDIFQRQISESNSPLSRMQVATNIVCENIGSSINPNNDSILQTGKLKTIEDANICSQKNTDPNENSSSSLSNSLHKPKFKQVFDFQKYSTQQQQSKQQGINFCNLKIDTLQKLKLARRQTAEQISSETYLYSQEYKIAQNNTNSNSSNSNIINNNNNNNRNSISKNNSNNDNIHSTKKYYSFLLGNDANKDHNLVEQSNDSLKIIMKPSQNQQHSKLHPPNQAQTIFKARQTRADTSNSPLTQKFCFSHSTSPSQFKKKYNSAVDIPDGFSSSSTSQIFQSSLETEDSKQHNQNGVQREKLVQVATKNNIFKSYDNNQNIFIQPKLLQNSLKIIDMSSRVESNYCEIKENQKSTIFSPLKDKKSLNNKLIQGLLEKQKRNPVTSPSPLSMYSGLDEFTRNSYIHYSQERQMSLQVKSQDSERENGGGGVIYQKLKQPIMQFQSQFNKQQQQQQQLLQKDQLKPPKMNFALHLQEKWKGKLAAALADQNYPSNQGKIVNPVAPPSINRNLIQVRKEVECLSHSPSQSRAANLSNFNLGDINSISQYPQIKIKKLPKSLTKRKPSQGSVEMPRIGEQRDVRKRVQTQGNFERNNLEIQAKILSSVCEQFI